MNVAAAPPGVGLAVSNPIHVLDPMHLGQMFFDPSAEVFYQARGTTAADWRLVEPADMPGSFVKQYDYFLGAPGDDPTGRDAEEFLTDSARTTATMALDGVSLISALAWKTFAGADVAMVRFRARDLDGLSIYFGFAESPKPHFLPAGPGFSIVDGASSFGAWQAERAIRPKTAASLRVERYAEGAIGFVDDLPVGEATFPWAIAERPVFCVFNRRKGPRPVAPGYPETLGRAMKR